jgi:hypothetical protein
MTAEFFDNFVLALESANQHVLDATGRARSLADLVISNLAVYNAVNDALSAAWYYKRLYDGVRPFTAIRTALNDTPITSWGGPGVGPVTMRGRDFTSYLHTDPFPEHPSGASCICNAMAEAARLVYGSDTMGPRAFAFTFPAGASVVEPGTTPRAPVTVGPFATFTQLADECAASRVHAGVHFWEAVAAPVQTCRSIARQAAAKAQALLTGTQSPATATQ